MRMTEIGCFCLKTSRKHSGVLKRLLTPIFEIAKLPES